MRRPLGESAPVTNRAESAWAAYCGINRPGSITDNVGRVPATTELLLADAEWSQWSDREIARRCQVNQSFVTRLRRTLSDAGHEMRQRKVKRGDKVYEMRARKNDGQTPAPGQAVSLPNEAPSTPRPIASAFRCLWERPRHSLR